MKYSFLNRPITGFIFTSAAGVMLHFLYEKTGNSILFAPFCGVNESTWEHMKLLFFPLFVYALLQNHFYPHQQNFWRIKLTGMVTGIILIPVLFYTLNGAFGKTPDWLNISVFFISAAAVFVTEKRLFARNNFSADNNRYAFCLMCLLCAVFIIFTFVPPEIPLFRDPTTGRYGI